MTVHIHVGDATEVLRGMEDESVHMVVTSPPYWGLRAYKGDGGMIGMEPTLDEHIDNLVDVFRAVRKVLRKDGTVWLNYGDAYAGGGRNAGAGGDASRKVKQSTSLGTMGSVKTSIPYGLKPKDLMMMPARVAMALQADGWWLRSEIVWCLSGGVWLYAKTNSKPPAPRMLKDLVRLDPETVQLWTGEQWTKVMAWTESHPKSDERVELILRSGERIGCTAGHVWPTARGNVRTDELVIGDKLGAGDSVRMTTLPDGDKAPAWLTDESLWFAGLYLAEGSMAKNGKAIQISGHVKEVERWERIRRLCKHYGALPRIHTYNNVQHIVIERAAALCAVLNTVVVGYGAKKKSLNINVWSWSNKALRHIVNGYLEGDGHVDGSRIRLGFTRNYRLERDLRCLAARLGATLTLKPTHATLDKQRFPAFRGEWRWERSGHHNEKSRGEVMILRRSRARKFWDVTVEDTSSLFSLASGVLTHNSKPNPMPESVRDRPSSAHEKLFLFSRSARYFYDAEAVRVESRPNSVIRAKYGYSEASTRSASGSNTPGRNADDGLNNWNPASGANLRNVWRIPTQGFSGAHFATFPTKMVEPCIKAGTSEYGCCPECGTPWARVVERTDTGQRDGGGCARRAPESVDSESRTLGQVHTVTTKGFHPTCEHDVKPVPCTVLDPFGGSGTTGLVADRLGRDAILIEISPEYAQMAENRIGQETPLLTDVRLHRG